MTTIEVRPDSKFGMDEILDGISKLETPELEKFVEKVLALRARRQVPNLSKQESELLKKINRGLPLSAKKRLVSLELKQSEGTLTEAEHHELLGIVDDLETLNVERVHYLSELARLKGLEVKELMKQLGIGPKPYA